MGRSSVLSLKQWADIEKRILSGEKIRPLSREYGISEAAIRKRLGAQVSSIKRVANQIVETDLALSVLSIGAQISAHNLADELKAISLHLGAAAKYGAMTASALSKLAHDQIDSVDLTDPELTSLKQIAALTRVANDSSNIGVNLLKANKEAFAEPENTGFESILSRVRKRDR